MMMMEGAGFDMHDLGIHLGRRSIWRLSSDASPCSGYECAAYHHDAVVYVEVEALKAKGTRRNHRYGGRCAVHEAFAEHIEADPIVTTRRLPWKRPRSLCAVRAGVRV